MVHRLHLRFFAWILIFSHSLMSCSTFDVPVPSKTAIGPIKKQQSQPNHLSTTPNIESIPDTSTSSSANNPIPIKQTEISISLAPTSKEELIGSIPPNAPFSTYLSSHYQPATREYQAFTTIASTISTQFHTKIYYQTRKTRDIEKSKPIRSIFCNNLQYRPRKINSVRARSVLEGKQYKQKHDRNLQVKALLGKQFILNSGEALRIYVEAGKIKAKATIRLGNFKRSLDLPVYFEESISLQEKIKSHHIQLVLPEDDKQTGKGYVYVGKRGLLGGGNESSKGEGGGGYTTGDCGYSKGCNQKGAPGHAQPIPSSSGSSDDEPDCAARYSYYDNSSTPSSSEYNTAYNEEYERDRNELLEEVNENIEELENIVTLSEAKRLEKKAFRLHDYLLRRKIYMKERRGLGSDWEFMRYDADLYSQEEALIEQATKYLYRAIDIKENLEDLEDKEAFEAFIKDITGHLEKRIKTLCALLENKLDLNGIAEKVTKVRNQIQEARSELTNYNTKQDKSAAFAYLREIEEGLINKHTKRQEELNTPDSGVFNTMAYQVNNLADLVGRYLIEKETGNAVDYQENGKELLRQINNLREITEACYQVVCDVSMIQEVGIGNELMDQDLAQKEGILSRLQVLENQLNNSDKLKKEANHASREAITHAAQKAVEEIISTDEGKKESRCNEGVNLAFEKLTGSKELAGKRANQMIEHCASSPNWEEIDISQAQELANQGYIVVAGWHSLSTTKSGHIALVVPGEEEKSNSWGCNVPKTMDTGENQRWACKKMTEGFGKNKKERTKFYRYKGPIKKIIN